MKQIITNKTFCKFTKAQILQLFKPSINPKLDDALYCEINGLNQNTPVVQNMVSGSNKIEYPAGSGSYITGNTGGHFGINQYDKNSTENAIPSIFNKDSYITNLFLVTQNFIDFMNALNGVWYQDVYPDVFSPITYTTNPTTGEPQLDTSVPVVTDTNLLNSFIGPAANKSEKLAAFEAHCANGIYYRGGVPSQHIPELFLRCLYSTRAEIRDIAFNVARDHYGIDSSIVDAARKEIIPSENFDSDKLQTSLDGDVMTFLYDEPFKFQKKYIQTIDNVGNKELFFYFPLISGAGLHGIVPTVVRTVPNTTSSAISSGNITTIGYHGNYRPDWSTNNKPPLVELNDTPTLFSRIWSKSHNKPVYQAGYTAMKISEAGQGGDIIFDHTDKIEYVDKLTVKIVLPTLFS